MEIYVPQAISAGKGLTLQWPAQVELSCHQLEDSLSMIARLALLVGFVKVLVSLLCLENVMLAFTVSSVQKAALHLMESQVTSVLLVTIALRELPYQ